MNDTTADRNFREVAETLVESREEIYQLRRAAADALEAWDGFDVAEGDTRALSAAMKELRQVARIVDDWEAQP
jgi:hypothetical protein